MFTFIIRRVLYSIPVLFVSTYLSFLFVSFAGNPLANLEQNPRIPPQTLINVANQNHLNVTPFVRYFYWLHDVVTHAFGHSLLSGRAIWPDLSTAMEHTAQVVGLALVLAVVLGVAVGIYSAIRQY